MKRYIKSNIQVGDYVRTPRFGEVKIAEVFDNEKDARKAGYTESAHYYKDGWCVAGYVYEMNHAKFAAYPDKYERDENGFLI